MGCPASASIKIGIEYSDIKNNKKLLKFCNDNFDKIVSFGSYYQDEDLHESKIIGFEIEVSNYVSNCTVALSIDLKDIKKEIKIAKKKYPKLKKYIKPFLNCWLEN